MFTGLTWAPLVEKKSPQGTQVTQSRSKTEPGAPMASAEKARDGELALLATQKGNVDVQGAWEVR